MRRVRHGLVAVCGLALAFEAGAADWVEVASPGRAGGGVMGGTASGSGERSVEQLVPFDGRLYPALQAVAEGPAQPIVAYDPVKTDLRTESQTVGRRFGRLRVLENRLYVPVAEPVGETGGYYVSAGGGKWEWVPVAGAAFYDVARFDGKTFLAGCQKDQAIVAWRADGETAWRVEPLNGQAARFSIKAASFLSVTNHLTLMAARDVIGDWPNQVAPREWGGWYVLVYTAGQSPRSFLFDGPARPLPALRRMAPDTQFLQNPKYGLARDVRWQDGLLYVVLRESDLGLDTSGNLFFATLQEGNLQAGRTFTGKRLAGMGKARDIAVEGDQCAVLLGEDAKPQADIALSRDLEKWETVFSAELPGTPLSLALLEGRFYIGLDNGGIVRVTNK